MSCRVISVWKHSVINLMEKWPVPPHCSPFPVKPNRQTCYCVDLSGCLQITENSRPSSFDCPLTVTTTRCSRMEISCVCSISKTPFFNFILVSSSQNSRQFLFVPYLDSMDVVVAPEPLHCHSIPRDLCDCCEVKVDLLQSFSSERCPVSSMK